MKTIHRKLKYLPIIVSVFLLYFAGTPLAFSAIVCEPNDFGCIMQKWNTETFLPTLSADLTSQVGDPVVQAIRNLERTVNIQFGDLDTTYLLYYANNIVKALTNSYLQILADVTFAYNSQIPKTLIDNSLRATESQAVNDKTYTTIDQEINTELNHYFTDTDSNPNYVAALSNLKTGEDTATPQVATGFSFKSLLGKTTTDTNTPTTSLNDPLNANAFFAPKGFVYNDQGKINAGNYIQFINQLAPLPPIININSDTITVPYFGNIASGKMTATIDVKSLGDKIRDNFRANVLKSKEYQDYRVAYRSIAAAKSAALDNLYRIKSSREIDPNLGGTSLAKMEYDMATKRMQQSYVREMANAPLAVIERERLMAQADNNFLVYQLNRNIERLILLQSINTISSLSMTAKNVEVTLGKAAGKVVYCKAHPDESTCSKNPAAEATSAAAALGQAKQ